ncbi:MAG TPA: SHOCT domain-containing protein [Terriglobales bacterium]|nr:SHOCT domain-containing protein [Terriglobales bacterium]
MPYYGWAWWWIWWVIWALIIIFAISWWTPWGGRSRFVRRETPLEILQRRLASGELTPQQYEEQKAILLRDRQYHSGYRDGGKA